MELVIAESRFRRRKFLEAISLCDALLAKNPRDENVQMLKCRCLINQNHFDELEFEEDQLADQLLDQNNINANPKRIQTSLGTSYNPIMHPTSQAGRILSGYQRPGTSRQGSRAGSRRVENILSRAGAVNPVTSSGRVVRLATASLMQTGDSVLNTEKLDLRSIAKKRGVSRVIWKYIFYVDHNLKRALELAAYATELADFKDPWWKVAVGKCYYFMGLLPEAEKQFKSSIGHNNNIESYLYLSKIQIRLQNPQESIAILTEASKIYPKEVVINLHIARVYESINNIDRSFDFFKSVLDFENCNLEAVASIASYYFYKDQAEIAARLYQRLIQLGTRSSEVWNNIGLCCFQIGRYDLFYSCFERALASTGDEETLSDIWYNLGDLYINLGNMDGAEMCFQTSIGYNPYNAQSLNNLAVLHSRSKGLKSAIAYGERSFKSSGEFDSAFNLSIWYLKSEDIKNARFYNEEALRLYPGHYDSLELQKKLSMLVN